MRSNPVYGKSLLIVPEHKIYVHIYPYMGNVEENEGVNCCETFAFKYTLFHVNITSISSLIFT